MVQALWFRLLMTLCCLSLTTLCRFICMTLSFSETFIMASCDRHNPCSYFEVPPNGSINVLFQCNDTVPFDIVPFCSRNKCIYGTELLMALCCATALCAVVNCVAIQPARCAVCRLLHIVQSVLFHFNEKTTKYFPPIG
jgi:hypothetical protein